MTIIKVHMVVKILQKMKLILKLYNHNIQLKHKKTVKQPNNLASAVHINCLCSRGFDHVAKQLGENLLVFTNKQLKEKRFKLEFILRFRYQSFVKLISQYYDKSIEHEELDTHYNPCIECYKNNMYMRYYQKKLELEFTEGFYFERYLDLVDHKKPLNNYILRLAFNDWSITSQVECTKRTLEQNDLRRKKLKEERDSREEQNKILLNPY